jgi:hypothetical protein
MGIVQSGYCRLARLGVWALRLLLPPVRAVPREPPPLVVVRLAVWPPWRPAAGACPTMATPWAAAAGCLPPRPWPRAGAAAPASGAGHLAAPVL